MPEIKLRCTACKKRHLADSDLYGADLTCRECGAPLDSFSFTTPERTRRVPAAVEGSESAILLDGLLHPLVRLAPGRFTAGSVDELASPGESPEHDVNLTQSVWIGTRLITQLEFRHLMHFNPSSFPGFSHPVENVSWFEAMEFCDRLTQRLRAMHFLDDALRVRLPTEAEWEYASRTRPADASTPGESGDGKDGRRPANLFGWGDTMEGLAEMAWFAENSGEETHAVGLKPPNAHGLFDMHGNVSEWCMDWYAPYAAELQVNPQGPKTGTQRVRRGGSWASVARRCRGTDRVGVAPRCRSSLIGFRIVLAGV